MARISRTVNPLHFEDLEPHRFEDLVRQLAYGYRNWRYLDATGRLGRDGGLDIRGVEILALSGSQREVPKLSDEIDEIEDSALNGQVLEERQWSIQCKRYKEIGPTLMREIVAETILDPANAPYGLIIAAACDVSAETLAVFREEAFARGVIEAHPWTKAHLEDKLFLSENDHLLFVYFGLSLGIRRQSRLAQVRAAVTTKRKLMRALKQESANKKVLDDVLIHDISDVHYPLRDEVPGFHELRCAPWHISKAEWLHPRGLMVWRFSYDGWLKSDGTWDILEESRMSVPTIGHYYWREWENRQASAETRQGQLALIEHIPESERKHIWECWLLPYDAILEVDPIGDLMITGTHLYCRFDNDEGPYVGPARFKTMGNRGNNDVYLHLNLRKPLFAALIEETSVRVENEIHGTEETG
jgi:hypothetical protein